MEPLHEALRLIKRQTELENAMHRPGGIRVTGGTRVVSASLCAHAISSSGHGHY
jgi:hypothetical protein